MSWLRRRRNSHAGAAIPLGLGAVAYVFLVRECGAALIPRNVHAGLLGAELLRTAKESGADLRQMQAAAASYLDTGYRHSQSILEDAANRVGRAIVLLTAEILSLVTALVVTLVTQDGRRHLVTEAGPVEPDAGDSPAGRHRRRDPRFDEVALSRRFAGLEPLVA